MIDMKPASERYSFNWKQYKSKSSIHRYVSAFLIILEVRPRRGQWLFLRPQESEIKISVQWKKKSDTEFDILMIQWIEHEDKRCKVASVA